MKVRYSVHSSRRGIVLVAAVLLVMMSMAAALIMTMVASSNNTSAEVQRQETRARYLAEGALNIVESQFREKYANSRTEEQILYFTRSGSSALEDWFVDEGVVTLDGHDVEFTATAATGVTEAVDNDGLLGLAVVFAIETRADLPGTHVRAHRLLQIRLVPIYQFAVFYDMDMDLWPGRDMTITGRVHTNGDLYLGASRRLRFDTNHVRAVGDLIQDRAWKNETVEGEIQFRRWVEDPLDSMEPVEWVTLPRKEDLADEGIPSQSGLDSRFQGHDANGNGEYSGYGESDPFAPAISDLLSQPEFLFQRLRIDGQNWRARGYASNPSGGRFDFHVCRC